MEAGAGLPDAPDPRLAALAYWAGQVLGVSNPVLESASGDASFRRYFRLRHGARTYIAMDAPPDREDSRPFVHIARGLRAAGLNVPEVLHQDLDRGLLLLSDLGTELYLPALNESTVERLYGDALGALAVLQTCVSAQGMELPSYDAALLHREMELFREWFLGRRLGLVLSDADHGVLDRTFALLTEAALQQPQTCVHRDYHSRNLLVTPVHNPGIVDFQDAVLGPVTYDLVSLLRDAYVAWPRERVEDWVRGYHDLALQSGILREEIEDRFLRWFDLMGVQRHLKIVGIFARLFHRDGKARYLDDIPRVLGYLRDVTGRYPELHPLHGFLEARVAADG
ncbi:MAG: aminoglycoside phosphotransferase [Chromatiales bacterium 21-64-14]|nr:MAG: aminoglycoside phosphotransferase [Chromatiales bacterium 21-64-14]